MDIVYLGLLALFAATLAAFAKACERLAGARS